MAVIEYDEYKQKLQALEPTLQELEKALAIPKAREELAQLQKETEQEGFWSDVERSQKVCAISFDAAWGDAKVRQFSC